MKKILFILIALLLATAPVTAQIPRVKAALTAAKSTGKAVNQFPRVPVNPVTLGGTVGIGFAISSPVTVPKLGVANTGKPVDSVSLNLKHNGSTKAQVISSSLFNLLEQLENDKNLETPEGTLLFIPHPQISPNPIDNFIDDFKIIQESTCPYLLDAEDENLFFVYIICQINNNEQAA